MLEVQNEQLTPEDIEATLEEQSALAGHRRYLDDQQRVSDREGFQRRDNVQKVISGAIPILAEAISSWVETSGAKKGRKPASLAPLQNIDVNRIALAALNCVFSGFGKQAMVSETSLAIGTAIQIELEADMILQADSKAYERFEKLREGEGREGVNRRRHENLTRDLNVGLEWDRRHKALVGSTVLNLILTSLSELFERDMLKDRRGTVPIISLTADAVELLTNLQESAAWMNPLFQPMLTPPRPWANFYSGAYTDVRLSRHVHMVRTFNKDHRRAVQSQLAEGKMEKVLTGLNAIQDTRFAIDRRILEVVTYCRDEGLRPSTSFPLGKVPPAPKKHTDAEWNSMDPETRTALSRRRRTIKDIRGAAAVESGVLASDLAIAGLLEEEGIFYIPVSMDFRGRIYAVPHLNPQRSDHIKALFKFADGVPLGPDGGKWLMIHLANCGDFGKISKQDFQARLQWVKDNEGDILMAATDPVEMYDWWSKADSPFCFLQACFEYLAWMQSGFSQDYVSHTSAALDGSCSGLQHYSCMTRSEEEGYHVNLLPRETPGDIYQVTVDAALPVIRRDASAGDVRANMILSAGFGRSEVKRNVMTYFYGSGKFGMRGQHVEDLMRPLADKVALGELKAHPYNMEITTVDEETGEITTRQDGGWGCAVALSGYVFDAVVSVAPKADEAARWFQHIASLLAHESLPVTWVSPTGLPVVQKYSQYTHKVVNLWLYDRKVTVPCGKSKLDDEGNILSHIQCLIREAPTKRIDKNKARNAISPNVVHSMDAAHMLLTVVNSKAQGIEHFQLIHDSFATHFGNTERFSRIIKETLVDMYTTYCPFEELADSARSALSLEGQAKIKAIPAKGKLDLTNILASEFVFS